MKTGQKGIKLIKDFETFQAKAYVCPAGVLTIGYGHTGSDVTEGTYISEAEADRLLRADLSTAEKAVNKVKAPLNQNQFDALVSFTFNCGIGAFSRSTLKKVVEANPADPEVASQLKRWNKAGGRVLNGLVRRREAEAKLYFS